MTLLRQLLPWLLVPALIGPPLLSGEPGDRRFADLDAPEHDYWNRAPQDPFTPVARWLEGGGGGLRVGGEKEFLEDLLEHLGIPPSSQILVFSTTSLQLRFISHRSPRAIYFNEDTYVAYIPGGRLEIISIDPELGAIFYLLDFPDEASRPVLERSSRCMNCHAFEDTRNVPGIAVKSVIPGERGGSLDAYRIGLVGHEIPLEERFGGWYVTGADRFTGHRGNAIGRFQEGRLLTTPVVPGEAFDWSVFPEETSDLLAHLVHEHQAGFVNRVVEAHYRLRSLRRSLQAGTGGAAPPDGGGPDTTLPERLAAELVDYLLFAEEAPLPEGGLPKDGPYSADFLAGRETCGRGRSLRDLDLSTRLFRHRCSYMVYRPLFLSLPADFKAILYARLAAALDPGGSGIAPHLTAGERLAIREILEETHPDLAPGAPFAGALRGSR